MKTTFKKLPFILAFVVTVLVSSCSDDVTIEPVNAEGDTGGIIIPPPPKSSSTASDTTTIG